VCVSNQEEAFKPYKANFRLTVIKDWVTTDIFVLPICFRNFISQIPDPGGIVIIQMQAFFCVPNSNYLHIQSVAGEQDFFIDPKKGIGIFKG